MQQVKYSTITACILAGLLVVGLAAAASPVPTLPMCINGNVQVDGIPAPVGTVLSVSGSGVLPSSLTLTAPGVFGGTGPFDTRLVVQGEISPGDVVVVLVDGIPAAQAVVYRPGAVITVNLTADGDQEGADPIILIPEPDPTPAPTPIPTPVPTVIPTATPTPVTTVVPAYPNQVSATTGDGLIYWATSSTQPLPPQVEDPACPSTGFLYELPTSTVTDNPIPLLDCPDIPRFVPEGTGALYVGAWGSECMFYLDGVLITNGGPMTLKGIPPGDYLVSYRETGYDPQDIPVTIGPDRYVMVKVNPREAPGYVWDKERISPAYTDMSDRTATFGQMFECGKDRYGGLTFIDGVILDEECGPMNVPLEPGIHHIRVEIGGYVSEYPVFIGAGTTVAVHGGSPVSAVSCGWFTCTYTPSGAMYRGIV